MKPLTKIATAMSALGFVSGLGLALLERPAAADNYQRVGAVDCTMGDPFAQHSFKVNDQRAYAVNRESTYRGFYCAMPMETTLDTNKIKGIAAHVYLGYAGTAANNWTEDFWFRPCSMLGANGGLCANGTYSTSSVLGDRAITVSLAEGANPNVFSNKVGLTPYIIVNVPGLGFDYSRINGFYVTYNP